MTNKIVFLSQLDLNLIKFRLPIMETLVEKGWEVIALIPQGKYTHELCDKGIDCVFYDLDRKSLNPFKELYALFDLYRKLKAIRPDILHAFTPKPNIYGAITAFLLRIPTRIITITGLGTFYTSDSLFSKMMRVMIINLYRLVGRMVSYVIFQNGDDSAYFLEKMVVKPSQVKIIKGSGLDTVFWQRETVSKDRDVFKVLVSARLLRSKGVMEYCEAAKALKEKYSDKIAFYLSGDYDSGNPHSFSEKDLAPFFDSGIVEFLGWRDDLKVLMSEMDLYVLPSYREGMPRTCMEAASLGLPVITCDVPGCREVVEDGKNGFLVKAKSTQDLLIAIEKLYKDKDLYQRFSEYSRKKAVNEFDSRPIVKSYLSVYGID